MDNLFIIMLYAIPMLAVFALFDLLAWLFDWQ
jgi:hypothetical protein